MLAKPILNELKTQSQLYKLTLFTTIFAFCVAVLGAYTRLTDAGLGCPDWPGCYGQLIVSKAEQSELFNTTFNYKKAWTEMAHRYLAGLLGLLILFLGLRFFKARKQHFLQENLYAIRISALIIGLVVLQALLGMWTVTLKLFPAIVMAHLLMGLTMLSLLFLLSLILKQSHPVLKKVFMPSNSSSLSNSSRVSNSPMSPIFLKHPISSFFHSKALSLSTLKIASGLGLVLLFLQIFLGGWTSANYAALVCLDFPACFAGQYLPGELNLTQAFNFFAEKNTASVTIHMAHRLGALLTALVLYGLCIQTYRLIRLPSIRKAALIITVLLSAQILLGILNVITLLPLSIALAHHAVAALLLLSLVNLNFQFYHYEREQH